MIQIKKIITFDVESNGLLGQAFCVGAVLMNDEGKILDQFIGRCLIEGVPNSWVEKNVLPKLKGVEVSHQSSVTLRAAFWNWFQKNKAGTIVVVDIGYPVEAKFLLECQQDNLAERMFEGPYSLHEVASFLLAAGIDPDVNREEYAGITDASLKHNPVHDAKVSALCFLKAQKG